MMSKPNTAIVISSKSAKEVLRSTRCLHQLRHCAVYWLTEPEFFGILPDSRIYQKIDIASNEAILLPICCGEIWSHHVFVIDHAWVFDDDFRGRLFENYLSGFIRCRDLNCYSDLDDRRKLGGLDYIFELRGRVDDYIYHLIHKPVAAGRTYGVLGIYFGSGDPYKKLPFLEYDNIIKVVMERQLASSVVLFGPEENSIRADAIVSENKRYLIVNAVGKISSYNQLAHGLKECDVVLGEDNFGMHLAVVIGSNVVGLFGHTEPGDVKHFPNLRIVQSCAEVPCYPCKDEDPCKLDDNCWNDFDTEAILEAIGAMNPNAA